LLHAVLLITEILRISY